MTDSSIIQDARDVLDKWRKGTTPGPWRVSKSGNWVTSDADDIARALGDSPLIVGTAGNPELLDAIDGLLVATAEVVGRFPEGSVTFSGAAWNLAKSIVSADQRMSA